MVWRFIPMQRIIHLAASCSLVLLFAVLLPLVASAHERREVADGQYRMVVGFLDEPAFAGLKNGLDLRVEKLDPAEASPVAESPAGEQGTPVAGSPAEEQGTPVEGLADTLKTEVIYGDQTMELELTPAYGEPGVYESVFFPMATGTYTFHIYGEIEGTPIDESFTSSPEGFSEVEPIEPLQFPQPEASLNRSLNSPGALGGLGLVLGGTGLWLRRRLVALS